MSIFTYYNPVFMHPCISSSERYKLYPSNSAWYFAVGYFGIHCAAFSSASRAMSVRRILRFCAFFFSLSRVSEVTRVLILALSFFIARMYRARFTFAQQLFYKFHPPGALPENHADGAACAGASGRVCARSASIASKFQRLSMNTARFP